MEVLNNIISGMNKEELRFFKLFMSRTNANDERKDILLFDYIRKTGLNYDEESIFSKLYKDNNKNAFYRLKNRLISDISTSLYLQHYEDDSSLFSLFLISLTKFYYEKKLYKISYYFNKKAEQIAFDNTNYSLLDLIYTEMIKLSHFVDSIDPELYFKLRKKNNEKLNEEKQIEDIVAVVSYKIKNSSHFSPDKNPLSTLLKKTLDEVTNNELIKSSLKLRYKMFESVSRILFRKKDYASLEIYLLTNYLEFSEENFFSKTNHHVKLQLLTYFVNTLYKNAKYERSLSYTIKLREAIEEYQGFLKKDFLLYYYNALIVNYIKTNIDKAFELIQDLKQTEEILEINYHETFIYQNTTILWFEKRIYDKALDCISHLFTIDSFYKLPDSEKVKIYLTEMILNYELNDFDSIKNKIKHLNEEFSDYFEKDESERDKMFSEIMLSMAIAGGAFKNKQLIKKVKTFIELVNDSPLYKIRSINYNKWLKEKFIDIVQF